MTPNLALPTITPAMVLAIAIPLVVIIAVVTVGSQVAFFFGGKLLMTLVVLALVLNVGGARVAAFNALDGTRDKQAEAEVKEAVEQLPTGGSLNESFANAGRNIIDAGVDLVTTGTVVPSDGPIQLRPIG